MKKRLKSHRRRLRVDWGRRQIRCRQAYLDPMVPKGLVHGRSMRRQSCFGRFGNSRESVGRQAVGLMGRRVEVAGSTGVEAAIEGHSREELDQG